METELPDRWSERALGSVLQLRYGKSLTKSTRRQGAVPVLGSAGIVDWHDTALVTEPTIIVGRKGSVGTVYRLETPSYPIDTVFFTELKEPTNLIWLEALLNYAELSKLNEATGVPGLNRDRAHSVTVRVPPLPEQQRIAEILTAVDDSIRAGERVIEQAERVKKGLMEELLTGGLGSVAIERGEVPEGWGHYSLGELFDFQNGFAFKSKDFCDDYSEAAKIVRMSDFNGGLVKLSNTARVPEQICRGLDRFLLNSGDILIAMSGATTGKVGRIPPNANGSYLNQRVGRIRPKGENCSDYLWHLLQLSSVQRSIVQLASGNAQPNVSGRQIESIECVVPSGREQRHIAAILTSIDQQIDASRKNVEQQKRLKRGLMDDLLTGRVRTV